MKNLIAHFLEWVLERVLERKGTAHIAAIISVVGAAITLGGILFGFGGEMADTKSIANAAKESSEVAVVKADTALILTSELKGKVDAIYDSLVGKGLIQGKRGK